MILLVVLSIFLPEQVISDRKSLSPPIARCSPRSSLLNDCNWCVCNGAGRYQCAARSCSSVDKFGHFRDAIADISVGMEGRGSWRSTPTACMPNAHYGRDGVLCICNDYGEWPNPVCRDIFRVLYPVERTSLAALRQNRACRQNMLYLVGCNVCSCSKGHLDKNLCIEINCEPTDPLVKVEYFKTSAIQRSYLIYDEIYAACQKNEKYLLGCRECTCLRNNRLMCNNCSTSSDDEQSQIGGPTSFCDGREVNEIFHLECNFCQCDDMKNMYCTAKNCLLTESDKLNKSHKIGRKSDPAEKRCTVKEYGKSCKSCECADKGKGRYELECSDCDKDTTIHNGCVGNTVYEINCLLCFCYSSRDNGFELCVRNPICDAEDGLNSEPIKSLRTSHGGCDPFRTYEKDCNVCQCQADGRTLKCTSNRCDVPEDPTVNIAPIVLREGGACPAGSMYYQKCNICVCKKNNRSLCTTLPCD